MLQSNTLQFLRTLKKNNNKPWFDANRPKYEAAKADFIQFIQRVIDTHGKKDPAIHNLVAKDCLFRINRDIRFSQNKEPYKTHVAASISPAGRKSPGVPGFYVHFGADEVFTGGGAYMVEKDHIYNIRSAIAASPDEFNALIQDKIFKKKYGEIRGEKNKMIPVEFREAHTRQPLIANKQFYYMAEIRPDILLKKDLPDRLMEYYHAGRPVNSFLRRAMTGV